MIPTILAGIALGAVLVWYGSALDAHRRQLDALRDIVARQAATIAWLGDRPEALTPRVDDLVRFCGRLKGDLDGIAAAAQLGHETITGLQDEIGGLVKLASVAGSNIERMGHIVDNNADVANATKRQVIAIERRLGMGALDTFVALGLADCKGKG